MFDLRIFGLNDFLLLREVGQRLLVTQFDFLSNPCCRAISAPFLMARTSAFSWSACAHSVSGWVKVRERGANQVTVVVSFFDGAQILNQLFDFVSQPTYISFKGRHHIGVLNRALRRTRREWRDGPLCRYLLLELLALEYEPFLLLLVGSLS